MVFQHVVIRREDYVPGTRDRPEVGIFTQTHATRPPVPWGRIEIGDTVWMKWVSGPIVARAKVQGFRQIEDCTATVLRGTTQGFRLYDLEDYWATRPSAFFGMVIYLEDEEWLDQVIEPGTRSRGESWVVLDTEEKAGSWLTPAPRQAAQTASPRSSRRRTRTIRAALRFEVLRRDDFACTYCGRRSPEVRLHVDHVIPWSAGGETTAENLRAACSDCNLGKGAKSI